MGKPAARIGDLTVHGGAITTGAPNVLIGGVPAARMTDLHTCPMCSPTPHVGGPIMLGSTSVLIGGQPAARMGDTCQCAGPMDMIAVGYPSVLIGEGITAAGVAVATQATSSHFLDVKFVDQGGKPITHVHYVLDAPDGSVETGLLGGRIRHTGVKPGTYNIALRTITKADWSKKKVRKGEKVKLLVETAGIDNGAKAGFEIWERNANRADRVNTKISGQQVQNDKVEVEWAYTYEEEKDNAWSGNKRLGYVSPLFYYIVTIGECGRRSPLLDYKDWIEIELKDDDGKPVANEEYILRFSNGEIRKGKLDNNGRRREDKIPPISHRVEFPNLPGVTC